MLYLSHGSYIFHMNPSCYRGGWGGERAVMHRGGGQTIVEHCSTVSTFSLPDFSTVYVHCNFHSGHMYVRRYVYVIVK
jgi:hypothetical protein